MAEHAAFVFMPDKDQSSVAALRTNGLPTGVRYLASVTGPWQVFAVVEFENLEELPGIVASLEADPDTALVFGTDSVRKSEYKNHTALVRVDVSADANLEELVEAIQGATDSDEVDVVMGDFDILACVVDDEEQGLGDKIKALRQVDGVTRTSTLRVIDYVSMSPNAPEDKRPQMGGS